MNLMRPVENLLPKVHAMKSILSLLVSVIALSSIISIQGCTDKATEIRDQECANMKDVISKKARSSNNNDYATAVEIEKDVNRMYDEYHIKCDKKK